MTTVVFKNGVFAADSLLSGGDSKVGHCKKIRQAGNLFVGLCGANVVYDQFMKFLSGEPYDAKVFEKPDQNSFSAIVVNKETREVVEYCNCLTPEKYKADFYAIGSGREIAAGAMLMNATPKQAVEAAAKRDVWTGGPVQVVRVWK
jgi:ATP-dependent protease HslVU (ClpYQ) peptidase subunit